MCNNIYTCKYDQIGNRITAGLSVALSGYSANSLNPYISISNGQSAINSPTYDADGNMLTNGVWVYAWDAENRLASACSNGTLLVVNTYDHQSRRIKKEVSAFDSQSSAYSLQATASFLYDGWNPIREVAVQLAAPNTLTNYYTWGLDLSGSLQGAGGVGGLLAVTSVTSGGARPAIYFPCYDANGNVTGYLDTNGVPVAAVMYDAFGRKVSGTADAGLRLPYGFSTKYLDEETGLYYYGYRFYSPELGRWASRDPIGERGGENIYAFLQNNSPNQYDFLGLKCEPMPRDTFEKWLAGQGVVVDDLQKARLDNGCVGVACVMTHSNDRPDSQLDTTCWLSESEAKADCQKCKKKHFKKCCRVWAKQGRWKTADGKKPKPGKPVSCKSVGSIHPSKDTFWNYVTLINKYYVSANHGVDQGDKPQEFYVCDTPPEEHNPMFPATIWGATCTTPLHKQQ